MSTEKVMHAKDDCIDIGRLSLKALVASRAAEKHSKTRRFSSYFLAFFHSNLFLLAAARSPNRLKINCAKRQHFMRLLR